MSYTPSKERARVIRAELVKVFGRANVSVTKGTGTARSWVVAKVDVGRPADCTCIFTDKYWNGTPAPKPYRNQPYCEACKRVYNEADKLLHEKSNEAMRRAGYEHSTFTSDDGYGSEMAEFSTSVNVK